VNDAEGVKDEIRPAQEVARRSLALFAVVGTALGVSRDEIISWLRIEGLWGALTPHEVAYLEQTNPPRKAHVNFSWQFAWVYEITPDGLKPTSEVPAGQSIRRLTGRRLDFAIIVVLSIALAYFIADKFWLSAHSHGTSASVEPAAIGTPVQRCQTAKAARIDFNAKKSYVIAFSTLV
jgi:hypothetical protein